MSENEHARGGVPRRLLEPPRKGPYKRFFAWLLSRLQTRYGDEIERRKRTLLAAVHGTVVEIGAGAGANLRLYPQAVDLLLLIEPNAHLRPYLRREASRQGRSVEVRSGTAEHMEVADEFADFVVSTLVLCSVDDLRATLDEVLRVLKPGGVFVFVEHVAAPRGTPLRRWQRRLRRFWRMIGDGCTLDREIWAGIEEAGFRSHHIEHFEADNLAIVRPHIAGTAVKG
ncbi:MAG: class I SAM-dependent methyltransferase [Acidobacteriota bacterium]|jgi:ubiquinone/menaquinone biosynthesis C-methylase UbiE